MVPGFVIQAGDPTGTGEGGESIYDVDKEDAVYDAEWSRLMKKEVGEKIEFGDEGHSRLRFNRRGLVGMAKSDGGYGSQFFITLGDCRAELDRKCTMFGRVEGEGIYNVVKIAEGEVVEGTERPVYPVRITGAEVLQMPKGPAWEQMRARVKIVRTAVLDEERPKKKVAGKKKVEKGLLSFGDEGDEDGGMAVKPKKAKFNTRLISGGDGVEEVLAQKVKTNGASVSKSLPQANARPEGEHEQRQGKASSIPSHRRRTSSSPIASASHSYSPKTNRRKPSFHDTTTQLPLKDPESPSDSPSPSPPPSRTSKPSTSNLNAEIAALKASMRRDIASAAEPTKRKSALESMIPATSIRGRKRPRPGDAGTGDASTLKILNAFRAKLESADVSEDRDRNAHISGTTPAKTPKKAKTNGHEPEPEGITANDDEEAELCDLHFIANCQSCRNWDRDDAEGADGADNEDPDWMKHALSFEKDRLGKDLTWKRKNEEELVVIDPREKEKEIKAKGRMERDRERERKKGGAAPAWNKV